MTPRNLLMELPLFLAPFLVYALYLWARGHGWREPEHWRGIPLAWLVGTGLALVAASLFYTALTTGAPRDGVYTPAHMEGGKLVPGHIDPPPK